MTARAPTVQIIKQEPGFPPKRVLHGGLNLSRLALPGAETKQGHLGSGAQGQRGVHLAFGDGVDLGVYSGRLARRRRRRLQSVLKDQVLR